MIFIGVFNRSGGDNWGGTTSGDSAMSAKLVSSAIPLPAQPAENENVLATESKGLSESVSREKLPEPEAIPIPDKTTKLKPEKLPRTPTAEKPRPEIKASNVVPFGQGGPVSAPYTMFKSDLGSGGMTFGPAGSFGNRYSWYVDAVRRKVSENWLKYEVDPSITNASRVYLTFEIERSGQPGNIQITQGSGVPSLDMSAKRALQRIDTFGPLPPDYPGNRVSVEFWFDYKK
jgi:protein TonB